MVRTIGSRCTQVGPIFKRWGTACGNMSRVKLNQAPEHFSAAAPLCSPQCEDVKITPERAHAMRLGAQRDPLIPIPDTRAFTGRLWADSEHDSDLRLRPQERMAILLAGMLRQENQTQMKRRKSRVQQWRYSLRWGLPHKPCPGPMVLATADVPAGQRCPESVASLWKPGAGYCITIDFLEPDTPLRRWSDEQKAKVRRRRLAERIRRTAPLFAEELIAREMEARRDYFDGK